MVGRRKQLGRNAIGFLVNDASLLVTV